MKPKVFGIYDFNSMPFSLGDIIMFIAFIQTVRYRNNMNHYDICFIANCDGSSGNLFNEYINNNNVMQYYLKLIDILQINNSLQSIYYCNSYDEFYELYMVKNSQNYIIWPELSVIENKEYLHYTICHELHLFKHEFGLLPSVFNSSLLTQWAHTFFKDNCCDSIPVTINLRLNKYFSFHRNATLEPWLDFFSFCNNKYPVKFVIICSKSEIDERLYGLANVIIAKTLNTTISQDISLVANSPLHLGSPSGPATITPFVNHPSILLNCDMLPHINLYGGSLLFFRDQHHLRFSFSNDLHYYSTFPESTDYLLQEFASAWSNIDSDKWKHINNYWLDNTDQLTTLWLD